MKQLPDKKEMTTLSSCLETLKKNGYTENFMVNEYGLHALNSEKYYSPGDIKITNFYRFEGESDPADGSILYAIETRDGLLGTLTDGYGIYSDEKVSHLVAQVEEMTKRAPHST